MNLKATRDCRALLTAYNLLQPKVMHIQCHNLQACASRRQLFCILGFATGERPSLNPRLLL